MRGAAVIGLAGVVVLLFAAGSNATPAHGKTYWGRGVRALLPANAGKAAEQYAEIDYVSCPSPGNCGAVGGYEDPTGRFDGVLLNERNGTWPAGVEARLPGAAASSRDWAIVVSLDDISCASAGNCTAVGYYVDRHHLRGLMLEETDGVWGTGVWAKLPANAARNAEDGSASSVSCWSAGNCVAVGDYDTAGGNDEPVLWTQTGGVWARGVEVRLPANATSKHQQVFLDSVSCPSAGNCTAVGGYFGKTRDAKALVMDETAGTWNAAAEAKLPANAKPTHNGDSSVSLGPVSCASAGNCSAVGWYSAAGAGRQGLLVSESDGTWQTGVEADLPAGAAKDPWADIAAISCASAGNCSAVGAYTGKAGRGPLVLLTESAGTWSAGVRAQLPADAGHDQDSPPDVESISCPTAGNCVAAGTYPGPGHGSFPLVVTQTDGVWARGIGIALPMNAAARYQNSSATVSCASIESCNVVGFYASASSQQGLLVSGPSLRSLVSVPALEGKTVATAKRSIRAHGCSVGTVTYVPSPTVERGRVISQRPKFGRTVTPDTKVNLEVSRG